MRKLKYEVIFYPGLSMTEQDSLSLVQELRKVAGTCFDEVPFYQVLSGSKKELDRAIIATVRDSQNELIGFCSALNLQVENVGQVFHTGLTCVSPKTRGLRLTHKLTSKLLLKFLLKESLFKDTWITNCACVLSSIGNIAKYFEDIYPSPLGINVPTMTHINIAKAIDSQYRKQLAINETAVFNMSTFVFEGSVDGTVFEKSPEDKRFHHREKVLTNFYLNLLNFERGDEVLQVGRVSLMTFPKYLFKQFISKTKKQMVALQAKLISYAN